MRIRLLYGACIAALLVMAASDVSTQTTKQILLIGDRPSHGPLQHEHNSAAHLFQKWLSAVPGVKTTAVFDGWPTDASLIDKADAIFMFCTGGNRHYAFQEDHAQSLQKAAARGAGLMFFHYCVEPGAEAGRKEMLDWIGGYFETHYSVNPIWEADFASLPNHPITRGVAPFTIRDEWYYNMRFREDMKGITAILTAVPGPDTLKRPDGPHSGNPDVRAKAGKPTVVMWAYERPNKGRGIGFTGGHYHMNLEDPNFRKLVLNSLLWIAKVDVPKDGVNVALGPDELKERIDPKPQRGRRGGGD
ncbi:MAG: ThuA domain-containing protein [Vicinamibacterales bacterium]